MRRASSRPAGRCSSSLSARAGRGRLRPTSRHWMPRRPPPRTLPPCRRASPLREATMELRHLRYFVAIAEEGSFTRAAERLWVAQPGLSTQIRRLETELGVQLLERHTRGADLTQAGELFLERARVALAAADRAGATGRDLETGVVGTIRLGIASGPQWHAASELLQRFNHERAGVELTVLEAY